MIQIPLPELIQKIREKSSLSEEEVNGKIDKKMEQLSGLISREGAAHIIANELGLRLFEDMHGRFLIKDVLAGMRSIEIVGKVQQLSPITEFTRHDGNKGKVCSIVVGDETGAIRVVLWGNQTDHIAQCKEGDIIKVIDGYVRENNSRKEIHLNDRSQMLINPEGETVTIKETKIERKPLKDLNELDQSVEIAATIVQVFDIRFFETCPQCGKRTRPREGIFSCDIHQKVTPDYSYVTSVFLDDGTETMRASFFRHQAEQLLGITKEEIMAFRENLSAFEEFKSKLLGEQLILRGRVKKNDIFDRLEFTANMLLKPNPEEETVRLKEEIAKLEETRSLPKFDQL